MPQTMDALTDRSVAWEVAERRFRPFHRMSRMIDLRDHEGAPCPYCGMAMTLSGGPEGPAAPCRDRMTPICRGGLDIESNVCVVCRLCNEIKGDLTLPEYHDCLVVDGDPDAALVAAVLASRPYASLAPFHDSDADLAAHPWSDHAAA